MLSKEKFNTIVNNLKKQKPYLFSFKENGSLEINLFVLQEVLKQLNYQVRYTYFQKENSYCIAFKLLHNDEAIYETTMCQEGITSKRLSLDYLTAIEIALLEKALVKAFKEFFKISF